MKISYQLTIEEPNTHQAHIKIKFAADTSKDKYTVSLPVWSPGSYLVREYSRHVSQFRAINEKGQIIYSEQTSKNQWVLDLGHSEFATNAKEIEIQYRVYCFEIGVRNSYIDDSHAFIHSPSVFMFVESHTQHPIELRVKFPALWSKIHTGLKDISDGGQDFIYASDNYDDFIDSPLEIGCHESDGFMFDNKPHHLAFYGKSVKSLTELKPDIEKIVQVVASHFSSVPYDQYIFITHFAPNFYGGLEHKNSTALHFDGRKLNNRKDYLNWLSLVAHEYFHTWNVKRIRPYELGPFDYSNENYTSMLWLAEGLTSFMDELFVYRAQLCTATEYLEMLAANFKNYYSIAGRRFDSLEMSSFNAWVKLYRPDENSANSTISYYLKGGLVFLALNILLRENNSNIETLINKLWDGYLDNPEVGIKTDEFLKIVTQISNQSVADEFQTMITTTQDIDFESLLLKAGVQMEWETSSRPYLGIKYKYDGERVMIAQVSLDSPAYKAGLYANDEILAINSQRLLKADIDLLDNMLKIDQTVRVKVARLGQVVDLDLTPSQASKSLKLLSIKDENKFKQYFDQVQ